MFNLFQSSGCPLGNGGGTCKTLDDVRRFALLDIGAVEIGSITEQPRPGNGGNTFYHNMNFTLNSLGLPNPGREYYEEHLPTMVKMIHAADKVCIVNVVGFSDAEYASLTKLAFKCGADYVVENYGCPNVYIGKVQKGILSYDIDGFKSTTNTVLRENEEQAMNGQIGIKLSPIFDPKFIATIASFLNNDLVPHHRIGFITTQNTVPNCFDEREPGSQAISPANGFGGMAGPAVLPMALGQVRQFRDLLNEDIKIIGVGGVSSGDDMRKMLRYGADFVQVVSAYYKKEDLGVFNHIAAEFMELVEE
jgi:dihydroorotate dehydrogenase (fumarate)